MRMKKKYKKTTNVTGETSPKFLNKVRGIILASSDYEVYSFENDAPVKIKSIDNKKYDARLTPCVPDDTISRRNVCCPYDYCLYKD